MNIKSVAFLGLGAMGYPMASHLLKKFDQVQVWNRTFAKAEQHAREFGTHALPLADAVRADVIFSCLPTSQDVLELMRTLNVAPGTVWIDCTSGDPQLAGTTRQLLAEQGAEFIDAPVSGQVAGAINGTLTVMAGGDTRVLDQVRPAIEPFARHIFHVGDTGAGFAVKAVNNTLLAANLWAAAEGLSILKASGVSLPEAVQCLNTCSGTSLALASTIPDRVLNRAFPLTFNIDLLAKDTQIALQLGLNEKIPTPVLGQIQDLVRAASRTSPDGTDFSALVKLLESWTGQEIS